MKIAARVLVGLMLLAGWLAGAASAPGQINWYVDDDTCPGAGTGALEDPFCRIQDGINAAGSGAHIWVAPGTYLETIDLLGKTVTLQSTAGPELTTIDATGFGDSAVRCMTGEAAETRIQGLTITGGSGSPDGRGGGMLIGNGSRPTVVDCTITGNFANFVGGGVFIDATDPSFIDCRFTANTAGYLGGGVAGFFAATTLSRCTFTANQVPGAGGGVYNEGYPSATITDCLFINNSAQIGGGMYNNDSGPLVIGCRFLGNEALLDGGGISNAYSAASLVNCEFSANTAVGFGGGLQTEGADGPTVAHCIFSGNSSAAGGAIRNSFNSNLAVVNSILWNNVPDQISNLDATTTVQHSNIEGGWTGPGEYNMNADPLWVDADGADDTLGTLDDDCRLQSGSPSIDAGDNALVPPDVADLDGDEDWAEPTPYDGHGQPRFVDDPTSSDCPQAAGACGTPPIVDMGAYEWQIEIACEGDVNDDGAVDSADLAVLMGHWGVAPDDPADFNDDGVVNAADLAILLGHWGACPED